MRMSPDNRADENEMILTGIIGFLGSIFIISVILFFLYEYYHSEENALRTSLCAGIYITVFWLFVILYYTTHSDL